MILRTPTPEDIPVLAALWHAGWHEAHAAHVPPRLLAERTLASFQTRLTKHRWACHMAGPTDQPLGFCQVDTDDAGELSQLFVAPAARGSGLAQQLLSDGERRLKAAGCQNPKLLCLPENSRAHAFYIRNGWQDTGISISKVETLSGPFDLPCTVFRKDLAQGATTKDSA